MSERSCETDWGLKITRMTAEAYESMLIINDRWNRLNF